MKKNRLPVFLLAFLLSTVFHPGHAQGTELWDQGISLIPYPQKVELTGRGFTMKEGIAIHIGQDASPEDQFTAQELVRLLHEQFNITARITLGKSGQGMSGQGMSGRGIRLIRNESLKEKGDQAYHLSVSPSGILISASGAAGLFYGMQTLVQLIQQKEEVLYIEGMEIEDWPDIIQRAVHYDSKHFQERFDYVKGFIRTLAAYKINMLVWEWEDKFAYPSHPEIGAPGAFTMEEMQELTRFAQQYHIQIVPLVQGLGHVSYLLKWPQNRHLREIPSSNWEICPLNDASYDLLFDLWEDAIEATPGSGYIHIGSDETWELGSCELCKQKSEEIGISGLYHLFIKRAGAHLQEKGRKVMCWETPMGWKLGRSPARGIEPLEELVLTESYNYETHDFQFASQARELGYELFIYDPNPGIEHLFLPYFYRLDGNSEETIPHLEQSHTSITKSAASGYYQGIISTSWNCSGVHNQIWMLRYITAAEYAWSYSQPELSEFADKYFVNYYGPQSQEVKELFKILNEASYFYMDAFERKVWHWGEIGKTHLPDLPRDDIEFDPYWNRANQAMIGRSVAKLPDMEKTLKICETNLALQVRHPYDFELFRGIAELFRHTARTYLALSALENRISEAHQLHFENSGAAYEKLMEAVRIVEENLAEREQVFRTIKTTWEKEQFPKGMSTPGQSYLHARDRQRNFANRRPDLTFMIYDEELLRLEDYLLELVEYKDEYKTAYLTGYEK